MIDRIVSTMIAICLLLAAAAGGWAAREMFGARVNPFCLEFKPHPALRGRIEDRRI